MSAESTEATETLFVIDGAPEGVPGGETDPLWYLLADFLAPHGIAHSRRRDWIEGFVAAMEATRGVGVSEDISGTLRATLALD